MNTKCIITIEYKDEKQAQTILDSIKVDNYNYVKTKKTKNIIETEITSKKISSLLHTIDDLLSCISVAEKIVE